MYGDRLKVGRVGRGQMNWIPRHGHLNVITYVKPEGWAQWNNILQKPSTDHLCHVPWTANSLCVENATRRTHATFCSPFILDSTVLIRITGWLHDVVVNFHHRPHPLTRRYHQRVLLGLRPHGASLVPEAPFREINKKWRLEVDENNFQLITWCPGHVLLINLRSIIISRINLCLGRI